MSNFLTDLDYFAQKMGDLCDRLGLTLKPSMVENYHHVLSRELSPELFERAWERLYTDYQGYGLPTPRQFVEAAVGTAEQRAIAEWDVLTLLADRREPCAITTTASQALRHIGGTLGIRNSALKDRSFLRRDFVQVYVTKCELGEFDGQPVELGQYTPVDFPDQIGGSNLRELPPGLVEMENQRRLAAMMASVGGSKQSRDLPAQSLGSLSPRDRYGVIRRQFDPEKLHSDLILQKEQIAQVIGQLRTITDADDELIAEINGFLTYLEGLGVERLADEPDRSTSAVPIEDAEADEARRLEEDSVLFEVKKQKWLAIRGFQTFANEAAAIWRGLRLMADGKGVHPEVANIAAEFVAEIEAESAGLVIDDELAQALESKMRHMEADAA